MSTTTTAPSRGRRIPEPDNVATWRLVTATQAGDRTAFGHLYARHVNEVRQFLLRRLPSPDLAEDLTAETFARALARVGSLSYQGRPPVAWLMTIARNILLDHLKSAHHNRNLPGDAVDERPCHAPGPEEVVIAKDTRRRAVGFLRAGLALLNERQRQCLTLRFLHELSLKDTAREMGITVQACKALQHRALVTMARSTGDTTTSTRSRRISTSSRKHHSEGPAREGTV